jgi:NAD-dependent DNA ligase
MGINVKKVAKDLPKMNENQLVAVLEHATEAYHNTEKPLMSDDLYDALKARLIQLNPKHSFLTKVGAPVRGEKVKLPYFMGSLDKIRDDPKVLTAFKKKFPGRYVVSDKLDGVSAMILYKKDGTATMLTRGDGTYGQNISGLIHSISSLPKPTSAKLMAAAAASPTHTVVVRGELILTKASWKEIQHLGANARNIVAGNVNAKHPNPLVLKHLQFVAYEMIEPKEVPSTAMAHLKTLGFILPHYDVLDDAVLSHDKLSELLMERRQNSAFECDGIVVRHDAIHPYVSKKNPSYAFAFKSILTHDEAEVIVQQVEWNVSKDGFFKPTLIFDPVVLAGVKIQRATGFNAQFIEKHNLGAGARVVIIRSGDVIPHVVRVLNPATSGEPSMPDAAYEWTDTHVDIRAVGKQSDDQTLRQIEFFMKQMEVAFMAKGTILKVFNGGFQTIPAIMKMTVADFLKIEGIQKKGAEKLYASLQKTLASATCLDYMNASNRFGRGIGRKKLEAFVVAYPEVLKGNMPKSGELRAVEGIAPATVKSMIEDLPEVLAFVRDINPKTCSAASASAASASASASPAVKAPVAMKALADKSIVFTGFRDKEWETLLKTVGCSVSNTVSKKVTLVVAKDVDEDSSKLVKAREYGITILSKDAFEKKYLKK